MTQKILIVGIGVMGAPMAKNIINAGFDVAVCDESSDALVDFHDIATLVSTSPSKAASNRNVIITVLPNSDIVIERCGNQVCLVMKDIKIRNVGSQKGSIAYYRWQYASQ